ncbi:MAG: hypothetical protein M3Z29_14195 [Pseudomonadota bacterium]|nr:hypothetical protein [Pseudomonadota bacterium]
MKTNWRTLWQQQSIVVYRDDVEVDRIEADSIERVHLIYRGAGDTPGDVDSSIVQLRGDGGFCVFEACTGFAGRVNFERQSFWQARRCVYWVPAAGAALPWRLRLGGWRSEAATRPFRRLEKAELETCLAGWSLEGPQLWEDRKKQRIERSRPFGRDSLWQAAA